MIQQTIQIGNSIGIVIPKNVLREKDIQLGDSISVEIKPVKKSVGGVDARFMKMVDEFAEDHKDVLRDLANR